MAVFGPKLKKVDVCYPAAIEVWADMSGPERHG
jgi:hypothetical protein